MSSLDNDTEKRIADTPSPDEESESPDSQPPITIGQSESDALRTRTAVANNSSTLVATSDKVNIATGDARLLTDGPVISNEPDSTVRGSDGKRHPYTESEQDGRILRTLADGTTIALANDGSKRVLETKAKDQSRQSFIYDGDKLIAIDRFGKDGAMRDSLYTHDSDKPKEEQKWYRWDDRRPSEFDVNNPGVEISAPSLLGDGAGTYSYTEAGKTSTNFADGVSQSVGDLGLSGLRDIFTDKIDELSQWFSGESSSEQAKVKGAEAPRPSKLQVDGRAYASLLQDLPPEQQAKWLERSIKENPDAYNAAMQHYAEAGSFSKEKKFELADQLRRSGDKDSKSEQSIRDASDFSEWLNAQNDGTKKEFQDWSTTRAESAMESLNAKLAAEQDHNFSSRNRFQWLDDMSNNGKQAVVDEYLASTDASEWDQYQRDSKEGRIEVPTYRGSKDYSYVYDLDKPDTTLAEDVQTESKTKFEVWKANVSSDELKAYETFKSNLEARGTQNYDFYSKLSDSGKGIFVDSLYSNPDQRQRKDFETWLTGGPQRPLPDSAFRTEFGFTKNFDAADRTVWAEHAAFAKFDDPSTVDGEFDNYLDWHAKSTGASQSSTTPSEREAVVSSSEPAARPVEVPSQNPVDAKIDDFDLDWLRTESGVNLAELDKVLDDAEKPASFGDAPSGRVKNPVLTGPMVMSRREGDNLVLTDFKTKATQTWKASGSSENGLQRFSLDPPDPAGRTPMITVDATVTGPRPKVTEVTYFKPESTNPPAFSRVTADAKGNATQIKRADGTELKFEYKQEKFGPVLDSLTSSDNSITIKRQLEGGYLVTENGQSRKENTVVVARTSDGAAVGAVAIQTAKIEYKQEEKAQAGQQSVLASVETELLRTDGTRETRTAPVKIDAAKFAQIRATILERTGSEATVESRLEKMTEVIVGRGSLKAESQAVVATPADTQPIPITIPPQHAAPVPASAAITDSLETVRPKLTQATAIRIADALKAELATNPASTQAVELSERLSRVEQITKKLPAAPVVEMSATSVASAVADGALPGKAKIKDRSENGGTDATLPGTTGGVLARPALDPVLKAKELGLNLDGDKGILLKRIEGHAAAVPSAASIATELVKPSGTQVGPAGHVEKEKSSGSGGGLVDTGKPLKSPEVQNPSPSEPAIKPGPGQSLPVPGTPSIGGPLGRGIVENAGRESTLHNVSESRPLSPKVEVAKPTEVVSTPSSPATTTTSKGNASQLDVAPPSENRPAKNEGGASAPQLSESDRAEREKARESYSHYVQQNADKLQVLLLQNAANDRLMNNTGRGADEAALREIRKVSEAASTEVARQSGQPVVEQVRGHLRDQIAIAPDPGSRAKLEQIDRNLEQIQRGQPPSVIASADSFREGKDRGSSSSTSFNKDSSVDVSAATAVRGKDPSGGSAGGGILAGQGTTAGRDGPHVSRETQNAKSEGQTSARDFSPVTGRELPTATRDVSSGRDGNLGSIGSAKDGAVSGRDGATRDVSGKDGVVPTGRELGSATREGTREAGLPRIEISSPRELTGGRDGTALREGHLDATARGDGRVAPDPNVRASSLNPDGTVKNPDGRGIDKSGFPDAPTSKNPLSNPVGNQSAPLNFVGGKESGTKVQDGSNTKDSPIAGTSPTGAPTLLTQGMTPNANQSNTSTNVGKDPMPGSNPPPGSVVLQPINLPGVQIGGATTSGAVANSPATVGAKDPSAITAASSTDPSGQLVTSKDPNTTGGKEPALPPGQSGLGGKDPALSGTDPTAKDLNAKDPKDPTAKDPNAKDPKDPTAKDPNSRDPKDPNAGPTAPAVAEPGAPKAIATVPGRNDGVKVVEQTADGVRIKGEKGESIEVRHDGSLIIRSDKSSVILNSDGSIKTVGDGASVKVNMDGTVKVGCGATFIIAHDENGSLHVRTESTELRVDGSTSQIAETTSIQRFGDGSTRISTDFTERVTTAAGVVQTNSSNSEVIETADRQVTVAVRGVDVSGTTAEETVTSVASSKVYSSSEHIDDQSIALAHITPPQGIGASAAFLNEPIVAPSSEFTSERSSTQLEPEIAGFSEKQDDALRIERSVRDAEDIEKERRHAEEMRRIEEEDLRDARIRDEAEQRKDEQLKEKEEEQREREEQLRLEQQAKRFSDAMLTAMATRKTQDSSDGRLEERQKYVVMKGDTLESIALKKLRNRRLSSLIFEINKRVIPYSSSASKILIKLTPRMVILLPTAAEVRRFESRLFGRHSMRFEYEPKSDQSSESASRLSNPGLVRTDTSATRSGAQGSSNAPLRSIDGNAGISSQQKRANVEKYLGPISPENDDARIRYNCRLGDTLRSVAMRHPALRDVSLWRLLAEVNDLPTETDAKGAPVAQLKRGTTIVLPVPPEISQFRRRASLDAQAVAARSMVTPTNSFEIVSKCCPQCNRLTTSTATICPACAYPFEGRRVVNTDDQPTDPVNAAAAVTDQSSSATPSRTDRSHPVNSTDAATSLLLAAGMIPLPGRDGAHSSLFERSSRNVMRTLSEDCRIITYGSSDESGKGYRTRLEARRQEFWLPVASYEINDGPSFRHEYTQSGSRRTTKIDLPPRSAKELADNDLNNNWETYLRNFFAAKEA